MSCTFTTATPRDVIKWASAMPRMPSKSGFADGGWGVKVTALLKAATRPDIGPGGDGAWPEFQALSRDENI